MIPRFAATFGAVSLAILFAITPVDATARGLGWATNNNYAHDIGSKPLITWYHHWQDGPVPQMPSKNEFVPMFWGTSKWNLWNQRVAEMKKKTPKHLMAFNEPDVKSQASMDAHYAANVYMKEIYPWAKKGVKLGSPAIVWDLNWMATFLKAVEQQGGHVDFLCLHWYGSWTDIAKFKKYIQTAHSRFGKDIWVTEVGVTSSSHPSQYQVKQFMMHVFSWLDTQSYVKRGAWFGAWESNHPPDGFSSQFNALLKPGGKLNDMGYWYAYTTYPDKRSIRSRHSAIAARNETETVDSDDPIHCDEICALRDASIEAYLTTLSTPP